MIAITVIIMPDIVIVAARIITMIHIILAGLDTAPASAGSGHTMSPAIAIVGVVALRHGHRPGIVIAPIDIALSGAPMVHSSLIRAGAVSAAR